MKKRIFIALTVILLLAITLSSLLLTTVAAAENDSARELDATTVAQLDVTDSYFYDRISERQQWCYNWLKDYYDNFTGEPGRYDFDMTSMLPEGANEAELALLGNDFIVADVALKADDPLYQMKGIVSGFGGGYDMLLGKIDYRLGITHMDINTAEAQRQMEARIQQIVETIGEGDRYTKLYKLVHYILTNTFYDPYFNLINGSGHYDYALATKGYWYDHCVYGLFNENIAVCNGFSQGVKVLCNELDIPCIIIGNEGHAWNMVQMEDGSWYHFDLTRDKLGWDGYTDIEDFYRNYFLKIDQWDPRHNPPYYTINVNNVYYADEFPAEADKHYVYTGSTTDFSYVEAPSTYVPCEPTFSYKVNQGSNTCTITNFEGREEGDLIIPESIDGYTVTAISPYAFYYCTDFTGKLVVPDTVTSIGKAAFAGCYNLTSLELSKNLEEIGEGAFIGCKGLVEVALPDSVSRIEAFAFFDCDKLTSVAFGGHIQTVGDQAFAEIASKMTIKAPAGSAAEKYATDNGISFEVFGEMCSFADDEGKWGFDDNGHFNICEHGARVNRKSHVNAQGYFNCGDKCEICGAQKCNKYGFMENVETYVDARPATCVDGYTGDVVCICGIVFFRPGETIAATGVHSFIDEGWEKSADAHYKTCAGCGIVLEMEAHRGGTATDTERAKCEVCGSEYGGLLPHEHKAGGWQYDDSYHFQTCSCGEIMYSNEAHRGGVPNENNRAICEVCGAEYYLHVHTPEIDSWMSNDTHHFQLCGCGDIINSEKHRGGTPNEDDYATCEVCGVEYHVHIHRGDEWKYNKSQHYKECSCGVKIDHGGHYGGTATVTELARCKVCGAEYGELLPHEHTGGTATETEQATCEICKKPYGDRLPLGSGSRGEENPSEKAPLDPTFIIIGVAAAVVLIVAVVLISVAKKKRTAKSKREE